MRHCHIFYIVPLYTQTDIQKNRHTKMSQNFEIVPYYSLSHIDHKACIQPQDAVDRIFEWSGMGAQYVNYITAGLALEAFSKYGKAQMMHADRLLKVGLTKILQTRGCLPDREFSSEGKGTPRSMNLIKVSDQACCL